MNLKGRKPNQEPRMGQFDSIVKLFREKQQSARVVLNYREGGVRLGQNDGSGWIDIAQQRIDELKTEIAEYGRIADEWKKR